MLSSSFSKDIRFYAFYYGVRCSMTKNSIKISSKQYWWMSREPFLNSQKIKRQIIIRWAGFSYQIYNTLDSYIQISYIKRAFGDFYCSPFPFLLPNLWGELGNEIGTYLKKSNKKQWSFFGRCSGHGPWTHKFEI